mgnify:CR=1 FL=1
MNIDKRKMIGLALTIGGAILSICSDKISDKKIDMAIEEKVNKAVAKALETKNE